MSRLENDEKNNKLKGSHIPRLSPGIKGPMPSWIQTPDQDRPPVSKLENALISAAVFWFAVMVFLACYFLN